MIISWLIYLATAIGCAAFFVFYSDLLALIVLISVLCVPVLLFIIHLTSFLLTKIEVEFDESQMGANKPVNLLIKVTNRSLFAITNIKLTSDFKNLFLNTEHSCKFVINAVPLSTKVFTYRLNSEHVGNVEFTLKKAQFFDFFSMFMLSKKLNIKKIVSLYPETVPVSSTIRPNNWFIGESDKFSNVKAGDDPSEVFNIREYVQGDKLNKIHWKLTSKTDTYMVKEYSLPVSDNVFVYLDLKAKDTSDESLTLVDSLIKSFASISLNFAKRGIVHYVGWYNSRRHIFVKTKIKSEPDVFVTLSRIFADTVFTDEPKFENCEFFMKNKYSHIVMMSSNSARDVEGMFTGFNLALSLMSIVSVEYDKSELPITDTTRLISVVPGAEDKCLHGIKF